MGLGNGTGEWEQGLGLEIKMGNRNREWSK